MTSKKVIIPVTLIALSAAISIFCLNNPEKEQSVAGPNDKTSVSSMIHEYTKDKRDIKLTVGLLKGDKISYKVLGSDSKELDPIEYEYESVLFQRPLLPLCFARQLQMAE